MAPSIVRHAPTDLKQVSTDLKQVSTDLKQVSTDLNHVPTDLQRVAAASGLPVPRGEKRRREIAAVAERVFFDYGFGETTMQTIAAEAGASKETLYRHFGSKEGLFSEIVENRANTFLEGLDETLQRPGTLAEALQTLGLRLLTALVEREALCLYRIVIAEGPRNPDLGRIFYEQGPERIKKRLTKYLEAATARAELRCADCTLAASIFLGAVVANYHTWALVFPLGQTLTKAQIKLHVGEVVAMFISRYAVPSI